MIRVVGYGCVGFAHTDYMERSLFMGLMWDGGESCVLVGSVVVRFIARSLIQGALSRFIGVRLDRLGD